MIFLHSHTQSKHGHTRAHTFIYLGSIHADNAVAVTCAVVKIGDCDSLLAGRNPVLLGGWVDLEDVGPGGVNWLLPGEQRTEERDNMRGGSLQIRHTICNYRSR